LSVVKNTTDNLKKMHVRTHSIVRTKDQKETTLLQESTEECAVCATKVKAISEFDRQQVCSTCFEQLVMSRIGDIAGRSISGNKKAATSTTQEKALAHI